MKNSQSQEFRRSANPHLKEMLDAAPINLTAGEVIAITQLVPEDTEVPKLEHLLKK